DPVATFIPPETADKILWLDAYLMNVDRTVKNTNILVWQKDIWLIDHGAALYFHHNIEHWEAMVASGFQKIDTHVLRYNGKDIRAADKWAKEILTAPIITSIIDAIPGDWLVAASPDIPEA